ncbi:glucan endo-1,3-beta-glucosidase 14 [Beta vulgaris subsp. vulgaris]|uniref:glucan endo-1,3-beta-glucosidase 14 n=1 Tax=Beta vulgaris subsp. vulgaris TaxID=3555 RepID=UPI002036E958|nr:glucan endo-1,3-beta-glucosidase 14 [Beta vulgaris subsp. vulgaris]
MIFMRSVMASSSSSSQLFLLFFFIISGLVQQIQGLEVGINYGQIANNLPSPSRVAILLQSIQVHRVKLYDADPNVLLAFANSNVEFTIGLGNEYLYNMTDLSKAQAWIQTRVQPYISRTKITCIVVGNEVFDGGDTQLMSYVFPAMRNVYFALKAFGLTDQVTVTTAHSTAILANSYPPSSGSFKPQFAQYLQPMVNFQSQIKSPFLINAYPFFAYKDSPNDISLDYVLFRPNQGSTDPATNLHYDNMLYAQLDAVYAAIKLMGHTDIEVHVSETGWPSKGDPNEVGATIQNAATYNGNLLKRVESKEGTPGRPNVPIIVYVFALFNENLKPGPASERNYGLYYPDTSPVYNIGLQKSYLPQFYINSGNQRRSILELCTFTILSSFLTAFMIFS